MDRPKLDIKKAKEILVYDEHGLRVRYIAYLDYAGIRKLWMPVVVRGDVRVTGQTG